MAFRSVSIPTQCHQQCLSPIAHTARRSAAFRGLFVTVSVSLSRTQPTLLRTRGYKEIEFSGCGTRSSLRAADGSNVLLHAFFLLERQSTHSGDTFYVEVTSLYRAARVVYTVPEVSYLFGPKRALQLDRGEASLSLFCRRGAACAGRFGSATS